VKVTDPLGALHGVVNACEPLPGILTGGQPDAHHLEALAANPGTILLDIRDPMEPRPFDEPALARSLGIEYVNVPVSSGSLSDSTLDRILQILRTAGDRRVFFHCGSGNRVGGALIPYLMIDKGLDEEAAIEAAMRVGLRSPELLQWGLDYTQRHAAR
jgi:rhodanese-related sulfurtransferase